MNHTEVQKAVPSQSKSWIYFSFFRMNPCPLPSPVTVAKAQALITPVPFHKLAAPPKWLIHGSWEDTGYTSLTKWGETATNDWADINSSSKRQNIPTERKVMDHPGLMQPNYLCKNTCRTCCCATNGTAQQLVFTSPSLSQAVLRGLGPGRAAATEPGNTWNPGPEPCCVGPTSSRGKN